MIDQQIGRYEFLYFDIFYNLIKLNKYYKSALLIKKHFEFSGAADCGLSLVGMEIKGCLIRKVFETEWVNEGQLVSTVGGKKGTWAMARKT